MLARRFDPVVITPLGNARLVRTAGLPIGAYEPRWFMKAVHMNPAEAVQAHLDLQATRVLGCIPGHPNDSGRYR